MNKQTLVTLISSIIVFVILCINTICNTNFELSEEVIGSIAILVATLITWACSNFFNQDYTKVARKMTPIMRKIKVLVEAGDATVLDQIEQMLEEINKGDEE